MKKAILAGLAALSLYFGFNYNNFNPTNTFVSTNNGISVSLERTIKGLELHYKQNNFEQIYPLKMPLQLSSLESLKKTSVIITDYNNDGLPDIVLRTKQPFGYTDFVYENKGTETFPFFNDYTVKKIYK